MAAPADDGAIQRDLLARPDEHHVADRDVVHGNAQLGGAATDDRFGRRQIHEVANRAACAFHRARLEQLRQREQEDDRRRLRPLAEHDRAGDGDEHQHVDVEGERPRGEQRAAHRVEPAAQDREPERDGGPHARDGDRVQRKANAEAHARAHDEQAPCRRGGGRPRGLVVLEPRAHARLRHRLGDRRRRQPRRVVLDLEPLSDDVRVERLESDQLLEPPRGRPARRDPPLPNPRQCCSRDPKKERSCLAACSDFPQSTPARRRKMPAIQFPQNDLAGAPRTHETHAAQQAQLVRDGGLAHADQLRDVADAEFTGREHVDNAYARRIAEDAECLGKRLDGR